MKDEHKLLLKVPADGLLSGQMGCRLHYWPDNEAVWHCRTQRSSSYSNMCMLPSGLPCLLLLCCPPDNIWLPFMKPLLQSVSVLHI